MKEKIIKIDEHCGDNRVSREDGLRMREWIQKEWGKHDRFVFDFNNILIASVSFMDEAFAKLAFEYNRDELAGKLKFENLRPFDRALLNDLVMARIRETTLTGKKKSKTVTKRKQGKSKNKRA